jgi:transcriptional regulator with XRE-family HTH domain
VKEPLRKLGEVLRKLRKRKDLTFQNVSDQCGIKVAYLIELEGGKRNPSLKTINRVARGLKVPLWMIFMNMESKPTRPTVDQLIGEELVKIRKRKSRKSE